MNTKKQWIAMLLMFAMLFAALPIAAFAEEPAPQGEQEESTPQKEENADEAAMKPMQAPPADGIPVRLYWHEYDQRGRYNHDDEGKPVTLSFIIEARGKNKAGKQVNFRFLFNPGTSTIGEKTETEIGKELKGTIAGTTKKEGATTYLKELTVGDETYTDVILGNGALIIDENQRIYSVTSQDTGSTGKITVRVHQNMETETEVKKASSGETILDSDKPNMNVRYFVQKKKSEDVWEEVTNANGEIYQDTIPFSQETLYLCTRTKGVATSFYDAVKYNKLDQFNPYTGKSGTFRLCAEWAGDRKAELKKRYDLKVDGNDLKGWTVTLTSKIKPDVSEQKEVEIDFETEYEDDPTMYVGEKKVKQEGVKGTKKVTITKYYIEENGEKKYLENEMKTTEEITKKPVNKIILRGTKKRPATPSVPSAEYVDIVFNANEGAWANGETRREYRRAVGSVISIESAPTREGYKFLYWKGSEYQPGENYTVPAGGHTFVAQWEKVEKKPEDKPSVPSVDSKIKTPRGSALTAEEIAKILAGSKTVIPAIPKAGVGR